MKQPVCSSHRIAPPGTLGFAVQPLTRAIAKAAGGAHGMIVTVVDAKGPAIDQVQVGDVIDGINDTAVLTPLHWEAAVARVAAGDQVRLRVRQPTESQERTVVAAPLHPPAPRPLGLELRTITGRGAIVVNVEAGSTSETAGVRVGDVITRVGDEHRPSAATVRRTFADMASGEAILIALTRNGQALVTALEKE